MPLSEEAHQRLQSLASAKKISIEQLLEEWSFHATKEVDAQLQFGQRMLQGSVDRGLDLLDRVDLYFKDRNERQQQMSSHKF